MCGIAGTVQFQSTSPLPLYDLYNANQQHQRRGPDSEGIYQFNNVALAHRRLKIFDLSDRAAQPMVDPKLDLSLVFNGAIYNFVELRHELQNRGYSFTTDGDTEVLLKAFHCWGESCVERFNGMFAFAIWDMQTKTLTLARDRLGIKPLYYANTAKGFSFASTLQAMLQFEGIDKTLNPVALNHYLAFHAVPEPDTLVKGIRKLSPGTLMRVREDGTVTERKYWHLHVDNAKADFSRTREDWIAGLDEVLKRSVARRLSADVPVGIMLSGGLDSSLLVALAAERSQNPVETFSIGFEGTKEQAGDEFYYSDLIARHYGTKHHKLYFSNTQLLRSLEECVKAMSEPMTSHDNIGFYLLSQKVSEHVKVAISGQGADEVFAGYDSFRRLAQKPAGVDDNTHYARNFFDFSHKEYQQLVMPEWQTPDLNMRFIKEQFAQNGAQNLVDNALYVDTTFALANGPLLRVDNQTMASSLEARVPFLDYELVEFAATIPLHYKLQNGGKYILKELCRKVLPREIIERPKGYFPVPLLKYMEGDALELMRNLLSERRVRDRGIFNPKEINALLNSPKEGLTPLGGSKLWQVGLLEYWLELNNL